MDPEVAASTFTVLIYNSEGAHSTAFPDFLKNALPYPRWKKVKGQDQLQNSAEMRAAVEQGLFDPTPSGTELLHFKRWTAHLGDMAIFSQGVMHHGTQPVGACSERLTLFSVLTRHGQRDERQDASQVFRSARPLCQPVRS